MRNFRRTFFALHQLYYIRRYYTSLWDNQVIYTFFKHLVFGAIVSFWKRLARGANQVLPQQWAESLCGIDHLSPLDMALARVHHSSSRFIFFTTQQRCTYIRATIHAPFHIKTFTITAVWLYDWGMCWLIFFMPLIVQDWLCLSKTLAQICKYSHILV